MDEAEIKFEDEGIDQDGGTNEIVNDKKGNIHDSHDGFHDFHDTNQPLNDQEIQSDSAESDREEYLSEGQSQHEASKEDSGQFESQDDSEENNEESKDDDEVKDQEINDPMEHEVTHESHDKDEKACDFIKDQHPLIALLTCTYHRGKIDVFATSKRQRAISPPAIKPKDKGKENMDKGEKEVKVRRRKRIKKTSQGPQFIDLDSDNEDKEMTTRLLFLDKDAQLREWEREFDMAQRVIHY